MSELVATLTPLPTAAPRSRPVTTPPTALVWDSTNTSAVVMARGLRRLGWRVHWLGTPVSPWRTCSAFDGERFLIRDSTDPALLQVIRDVPFDALFLHGDDQVRWMLEHWSELPQRVVDSLAAPESLRIALSKDASMQLASALGVPTLPTIHCSSPAEVGAASRQLAPTGGDVVLKGEGGAAGTAVARVRAGVLPDAATWARVTRHAPVVLVQKRIHGARVFINCVYEHGIERAAVMHEKTASFPTFGPTAFAVTRRVDVVHEYAQRLFGHLQWHGPVNIEFRQDRDDGSWYFMEINPRAGASLGIQDPAGIDLARAWTAVSRGEGETYSPGRSYRTGVRFAWGVRGLALTLRAPWRTPAWGILCLLRGRTDLAALDPALRLRALRLALWTSRHVPLT